MGVHLISSVFKPIFYVSLVLFGKSFNTGLFAMLLKVINNKIDQTFWIIQPLSNPSFFLAAILLFPFKMAFNLLDALIPSAGWVGAGFWNFALLKRSDKPPEHHTSSCLSERSADDEIVARARILSGFRFSAAKRFPLFPEFFKQ